MEFYLFFCSLDLGLFVLILECGWAVNRAKRNPDLKVTGVKAFTFEELAQATDNFSDKNQIGQGGYGKVYVGTINDGKNAKKQVAIKRAEEGSLQGAHEFYTEIELLSRVHHRNLVMLEGYCDDEGEQVSISMLFLDPHCSTIRICDQVFLVHIDSRTFIELDYNERVTLLP